MQRRTSSRDSLGEQKLGTLERDGPYPFYILHGPERFFIRRSLTILKKRILPGPDLEPVLYHAFQGAEIDPAGLIELAQTSPFFEEKQLLVIRGAERLRDPGHEALVRYAEDPAPFSCLVFAAGDTFPKGTFFRIVAERYPAGCLEFPRLKRSSLFRWISRIASEKGLADPLSRAFLEELVSTAGTDLEALENQIEKLALFFQDPGGRGLEDPLSALASPTAAEEGYHLANALLEGGWEQSLQFVQQFLDQGVPPLLILSRISWPMRKLWLFKETLERTGTVDNLARTTRMPPAAMDRYETSARRCSWAAMRRIFVYLEKTDRSLKSSRLDAQMHLEDLCGQIIRALGQGGQAPSRRG